MGVDLVVVGTGLIGGSFALAARRSGAFGTVLGVDEDPEHARAALAQGLVDAVLAPEEPFPEAGVLLAVPPSAIGSWVARLAGHPRPVTDVGSVKGAVLAAVRAHCGKLPKQFVPGHPVAGSERSGPGAARDGLFTDKPVVLTPVPEETDPAATAEVQRWWQAIGARVHVMDAAEHDRVLAFTSHLPHLVAFALMAGADEEHLAFAGGGFRDFTRIAASDPALWVDIFLNNRDALLAMLTAFEGQLTRVRAAVDAGDETALSAFIAPATELRRSLDG